MKKNKKSVITKNLMALFATIGVSLSLSSPAQAVLLVGLGFEDGPHVADMTPTTAILCVAVLPLCFLDQKVDGMSAMSRQDLVDNGYAPIEADQITSETRNLQRVLMAQNKRFVVAKDDNVNTIAASIHAVMPNASDLFVNFYSNEILATH